MNTLPARNPDKSVEDRACWSSLTSQAAAAFGTPCYLSRWRPVERMLDYQESRLAAVVMKSWLSFKTHPVPQLASTWIRSGRGVEVVSEAEFVAIRALKCPTSQLLVNGVAKHSWLRRHAVLDLRVHFDSVLESELLLEAAVAQQWRVGLRCHPPAEVDARDSRFGGQFGLSADEFVSTHARLRKAGVSVEGVHFHLGQGFRARNAYAEAFKYVVALCERSGLEPLYIDCGGGVDAFDDATAALDDLAGAIVWAAERLPSVREVWVENGRYLTKSSAALIIRYSTSRFALNVAISFAMAAGRTTR